MTLVHRRSYGCRQSVTRIWSFAVVLADAKSGQGCSICSHRLIENYVVIWDRVTVNSDARLWDGLRVGNEVFIGTNVFFTNDKLPRSNTYLKHCATTVVMAGATVEAGDIPAEHNDWSQRHVGRRGRRRGQSCADCWERRVQS